MANSFGRLARAVFAPKAVILGVATCQFGWALSQFMGQTEEYHRGHEELFIAFMLLVAAAGLLAHAPWGNLLSATLSGVLPLAHAFIFWDCAWDYEAPFLSAEHINNFLRHEARADTFIWLMSALSLVIISSAMAATLRASSRPATGGRA